MAANKKALPPGYRFLPSDLLLVYILWFRSSLQKVLKVFNLIEERDLYDKEETGIIFGNDQSSDQRSERYFITPVKKKCNQSRKVERIVGNGTWRIQNTENIYGENKSVFGFKKTLNFLDDLRDKRRKSSWIMHEYTLSDDYTSDHPKLYALCRIKRSRSNQISDLSCRTSQFSATSNIKCNPSLTFQTVKLFGRYILPKQRFLWHPTDQELLEIYLQGFQFHPTDQELLRFYLRKKIAGEVLPGLNVIHEQNLYGDEDPWQIWDKFNFESDVMYFFTCIKKKFENGKRVDRRSSGGTWRIQSTENVFDDPRNNTTMIGFKKALNFIEDVNVKSMRKKSCWIMHEYTLFGEPSDLEKTWAICRIKKAGGNHNAHEHSRTTNCEDKVDASSPSSYVKNRTSSPCFTDDDTDRDSQIPYNKRARLSYGVSTTLTLAQPGTDVDGFQ